MHASVLILIKIITLACMPPLLKIYYLIYLWCFSPFHTCVFVSISNSSWEFEIDDLYLICGWVATGFAQNIEVGPARIDTNNHCNLKCCFLDQEMIKCRWLLLNLHRTLKKLVFSYLIDKKRKYFSTL